MLLLFVQHFKSWQKLTWKANSNIKRRCIVYAFVEKIAAFFPKKYAMQPIRINVSTSANKKPLKTADKNHGTTLD
jgi:hypothetical protein